MFLINRLSLPKTLVKYTRIKKYKKKQLKNVGQLSHMDEVLWSHSYRKGSWTNKCILYKKTKPNKSLVLFADKKV